jgi:hypothetical protein
MKVNVYIRLEHHAYAGSHVGDVRVSVEVLDLGDEWREFPDIEVGGVEVDDAQVCRCGFVERGQVGRAYH